MTCALRVLSLGGSSLFRMMPLRLQLIRGASFALSRYKAVQPAKVQMRGGGNAGGGSAGEGNSNCWHARNPRLA